MLADAYDALWLESQQLQAVQQLAEELANHGQRAVSAQGRQQEQKRQVGGIVPQRCRTQLGAIGECRGSLPFQQGELVKNQEQQFAGQHVQPWSPGAHAAGCVCERTQVGGEGVGAVRLSFEWV